MGKQNLNSELYFEYIIYEIALVIVHVKTLRNKFADDIENDDKDQKNFILKIYYMNTPLS